ncbi:MAG: hypothetical protein JNM94_06270 [Phycisphaerae bacterium]|nr:hypothetical protein [Phycisphaerae bacterium]
MTTHERSSEPAAGGAAASAPRGATSSGHLGVAAWIGAGGESIAAALAGDVARDVDERWRWTMHAIGGERRSAAAAWAERTGAAECAHLRELVRPGVALSILLGREIPGDADLRHLLDGDRRVAFVGAAPLTLATLIALGDRAARLDVVPSFLSSEAWRLAQPIVADFRGDGADARVTTVAIQMRGTPGESTLDALLFDAAMVAVSLTTSIESVLALRQSPSATHEPASIVAIARCEDGMLLSLDVADTGGVRRAVEFVGSAGVCVVADDRIEWRDPRGATRERHVLTPPVDAVRATVDSLAHLAAVRSGGTGNTLRAAAALAEAAKLSARTGNAESPARALELAARP